jgi:hypothetical protein
LKTDTFGVSQNPEAAEIHMMTQAESDAYRKTGEPIGFYSGRYQAFKLPPYDKLRYRSLDDYEADMKENPRTYSRRIWSLKRNEQGVPQVNPEWMDAPFAVGVIMLPDDLVHTVKGGVMPPSAPWGISPGPQGRLDGWQPCMKSAPIQVTDIRWKWYWRLWMRIKTRVYQWAMLEIV